MAEEGELATPESSGLAASSASVRLSGMSRAKRISWQGRKYRSVGLMLSELMTEGECSGLDEQTATDGDRPTGETTTTEGSESSRKHVELMRQGTARVQQLLRIRARMGETVAMQCKTASLAMVDGRAIDKTLIRPGVYPASVPPNTLGRALALRAHICSRWYTSKTGSARSAAYAVSRLLNSCSSASVRSAMSRSLPSSTCHVDASA